MVRRQGSHPPGRSHWRLTPRARALYGGLVVWGLAIALLYGILLVGGH